MRVGWAPALTLLAAACTRGFLRDASAPELPQECASVLPVDDFSGTWSSVGVRLVWVTEAGDIEGFWITRRVDAVEERVGPFKAAVRTYDDEAMGLDAVAEYSLAAFVGACASAPKTLAVFSPPRAPEGATAMGGLDWLELTWIDTNSHEAGHRVVDGSGEVVAELPADSTQVTLSGLQPATRYDFAVVAVAVDGTLSAEAPVSGWTDFSAPSAVSATALDVDRVRVTWTGSNTNAATYRIERALEDDGWIVVANGVADSFQHDDAGLIPNTNYRYRVSAVGGESVRAAEPVSVRTRFGPQLTTGTPTLDKSCTLTIPGTIEVDGELGATLVETNVISAALADAVASVDGIAGGLTDFSGASIPVTWQAVDSFGEVAEAQMDIVLLANVRYRGAVPDLAMQPGYADGSGQQPWWGIGDLSGCSECSGARAGIALEGGTACVIQSGGTLACWGRNAHGKLGIGSWLDADFPTTVCAPTPTGCTGTLSHVVNVAIGWFHTCALTDAGAVYCWGRGDLLGNGSLDAYATLPQPVCAFGSAVSCADGAQQTGVVQIVVGGMHSCILLIDGTVRCWGYNADGQVGDGSAGPMVANPVIVCASGAAETCAPLTGVRAIAATSWSTCALLDDGTIRCWGANADGVLGDGTDTDRSNPTTVCASGTFESQCVPFTDAIALAAGDGGRCARTADGVYCWGAGVLNPEDACLFRDLPEWCEPFTEVSQVQVPAGGLCALRLDGTLHCMGFNSEGVLGLGGLPWSESPAAVCDVGSADCASPLAGVVALYASGTGACGVLEDGGVVCWGTSEVLRGTLVSCANAETCTATTPVAICAAANGDTCVPFTDAARRRCSEYGVE